MQKNNKKSEKREKDTATAGAVIAGVEAAGAGALDGYKILDFSTLLPGPYATMVLGDLGAEVLKVSSPDKVDLVTEWPPKIKGTDIGASAAWLGRNKKSIFLNLKKQSSTEAIKRLVREFGYDIVLEQFRPGVMERLGLSYEILKKENPRLIYCSITGYGQTGPDSMKAGHDINYLSRSGIAYSAGRKASGPALYNFQIADVAGGSMNAVAGIMAAIIYREKTGKGQYIDISMEDSLIPFHTMDGASFLSGGKMPERENGDLNGGGIYDFYETKDGGFVGVGSLEGKFFASLCDGLGVPEWRNGEILKTDTAKVKETFRKIFLTRTRDEWVEIFKTLDACVEPVMSLEEAKNDPHLNERGMWPSVPVPLSDSDGTETTQSTKTAQSTKTTQTTQTVQTAQTIQITQVTQVTQMGNPLKLSCCPPKYRHAGYPAGYHTREFLSSLGYSDDEIAEMSG